MKLCWLIPDDRGGGVVSVALSCARQARAAGHEVTVLMLLPPTGWMREQTDVSTVSLGRGDFSPDSPTVIVEWLRQHRPDVVLLNNCGQADVAIPFLPAGMRCVYVVHDTALMYWQAAIDVQDNLDAFVAVSQTVAQKLAARIISPGKLRVIPNGSVFPPPPDLAAARGDDLLFLGGGNPTKGAYDVLEVWRRLHQRGFAGGLHWFGALEPALRRRVEALPAAERVFCHGRAPRQAVFDTAARCKALLMLSRVEPFGMATIEAMSMGCVPVAWDIETGTAEIVPPGLRFFAPLGDRDKLAGQIRRVCQEHDRLAPLVARRAREHYGEEVMWRQGYAPLLDALMRQPVASRSLAGQPPPPYAAPRRRLQMLPAGLRRMIRDVIGHSPRLGYWWRDLRGT